MQAGHALGGWLARQRYWVLAAWAVVTVVGGVLGGSVYDRTSSVDSRPGRTLSTELVRS